MSKFGGTLDLEIEMKRQIIYYLLEYERQLEKEIENFKNLTELMRWLTFSTSSVKMINFFNEDVIPILIEYNHELSIDRLVKAYEDLFITIPKILQPYAPNDDSSSEGSSDGNNDQVYKTIFYITI